MSDLKDKSVLVIGGAGFIGSYITEQLLKEEVRQVRIFDNFSRGRRNNIEEALKDSRCNVFELGGDITKVDVLDKAMEGVDKVVHLAALWLLHCKDFPRSAFEVNIKGTFNVLEACVKNGVEKLVYTSSASVYGDALTVPMTEDHPFNNNNFYGTTKICGESMCRAFNGRYGLDFVGIRPFNVFGPRQDEKAAYTGVIPTMLRNIDAGNAPIVNGDGSQAYDFTFVEDVARAHVLALKTDSSNEFYNACAGVQTSIRDLCGLVLRLTGSDLEVQYRPYGYDDARALIRNRVGSTEKAERDLGFRTNFSLEEGLKKLIDWRKTNS